MRVIIRFTSYKKNTRGALTIVMALMMLVLALGSAVYTANTKLFDMRIANADLRKNQALLAAEAGIERAIAQLDVDPAWTAAINEAVGSNSYNVTLTQLADSHPNWENDFIMQITSTGFSDDNTGTRTLEQKVWVHAIARSAPNSAITVSGGMGIGGSFNVGANPNGGGEGVPLSVWSDLPVDLTGNGATCGLEEWDSGECATFPYSDKTNLSSDVFDDDLEPVGSFPADLLEYTFGISTANYQDLKDQAEQLLADCSTLDAGDVGLIWVTGDCTINAGAVVGSDAAPVILILEDSDLKMNGGAEIFGIVFSFATAPGNGGDVSMVGGAVIRGAFISDHAIDISSGTFDTRYDADVLGALSGEPPLDAFTAVEIIPGSWKDF